MTLRRCEARNGEKVRKEKESTRLIQTFCRTPAACTRNTDRGTSAAQQGKKFCWGIKDSSGPPYPPQSFSPPRIIPTAFPRGQGKSAARSLGLPIEGRIDTDSRHRTDAFNTSCRHRRVILLGLFQRGRSTPQQNSILCQWGFRLARASILNGLNGTRIQTRARAGIESAKQGDGNPCCHVPSGGRQ